EHPRRGPQVRPVGHVLVGLERRDHGGVVEQPVRLTRPAENEGASLHDHRFLDRGTKIVPDAFGDWGWRGIHSLQGAPARCRQSNGRTYTTIYPALTKMVSCLEHTRSRVWASWQHLSHEP